MSIIYPQLTPNKELRAQYPFIAQSNNYNHVVAMGIPILTSIDQLPELKKDRRPIAIIGGGKSLEQETTHGRTILDDLNDRDDVVKVVAGGTHRKLEDKTLKTAPYCVLGFVGEGMASYIEPIPGMTYIIAAQSHPAVFEKLKKASEEDPSIKVFAVNGYVEGTEQNPEGLIGIGNASPTTAIAAFSGLLGKKEIEVFGVDSSTVYAFKHDTFEPEEIEVSAPNGQKFKVDVGYYRDQTMDLKRLKAIDRHLKMHLHGNSLNTALMNTPRGIQLASAAVSNGPPEPG